MGRKYGNRVSIGSDGPAGGRERAATPSAGSPPAWPVCPECGSTRYRELHHTDTIRRYECGNMKCMESYAIPVRTGDSIDAARPEPEELIHEKEAEQMANLKCPKCGQGFTKQGWLERHAAKCDWSGAPEIRGMERMTKRLRKQVRPQVPGVDEPKPEVEVSVKTVGGSVKDRVLSGLRATIADLERKLAEAVEGIEKIEVSK